jgi:ribonucleotide monophosphatase NagD (HAD superfamily)
MMAIGDSVRTDFTGAVNQGIDCLFVTAGIHSAELCGRDMPDRDAVERIFAQTHMRPKAVTHRLAW